MKKISSVVSGMALAAMLLAACSSGGNNNNNSNNGSVPQTGSTPAAGTPAAGATTVTGMGGTPVSGTPQAGATTVTGMGGTPVSGTPQAGATTVTGMGGTPVSGTPQAGATTVTGMGGATVTPEANGASAAGTPTAGTPQAGVPATGAGTPAAASACYNGRVKSLFNDTVVDSKGNKLGTIDSVVILRDLSAAPVVAASGNATPEPSATPPAFGKNTLPQIGYLVVKFDNMANSGNGAGSTGTTGANGNPTATATLGGGVTGTATPNAQVTANGNAPATPTQTGGTTGAQSAGTGASANASGTGTATPAASNAASTNGTVWIPFKAFKGLVKTNAMATPAANGNDNGCTLTLLAKPETAVKARAVDTNKLNTPDWDKALRTFWSGVGVTVASTSATGADLGAPVVINNKFDGVKAVNAKGDELGTVVDFIFDPAFGQIRYGVLKAGGFLGIGSKYAPVPLGHAQWVSGENEPDGHLLINVPADAWKNAPQYDNPDQIDASAVGWDKPVISYWNSLVAPTEAAPATK